MQTRLPLDVIDVKDPCPLSWEELKGDKTVRYCGVCRRHVHNLSEMTSQHAASLLESQESPCVRFVRDRAGQVVTLDYQRASSRRRSRFWLSSAAAISGVFLAAVQFLTFGKPAKAQAFLGKVACAPATRPAASQPTTRAVIGAVIIPMPGQSPN